MNTFAIHLTVDSDTIQLSDMKQFMGKEVIVTVVELPQDMQPQKRNWRFLGAASLAKGLDQKNIRDLAYE